MLTIPVRGQTIASPDSITQRLNLDLQRGTVSPMVRVVQIREQLAADLRQDRVHQVRQLLAYLERITPDSVTTLLPYEAWTLLAAAGEFNSLVQRIAANNPFKARLRAAHQQPPHDGLFELTQAYLARHAPELLARAQQAKVSPEDSTFLQLALPLLTQYRIAANDSLNEAMQRFMAKYPHSNYEYFIERMARPTFEPSRFSYGLDFHSGTAFFTGGLGAAFRSKYNIGHGFEFGWDRYMLYLRNYIGVAEARTDFNYAGRTWPSGQRLNYYVPEISVGYCFLDGTRLRLTPFVGVSWCNFAPSTADAKKNPALDMDVTMRGPLTAGLNADVVLWRTQSGSEVGALVLKIRGGARTTKAPLSPATRGVLFYLDVGIGGFGRMMRQKKMNAPR
ncbi:MAG TPA: hypothetical protein VF690_14465 [Hymenobacter sp.]